MHQRWRTAFFFLLAIAVLVGISVRMQKPLSKTASNTTHTAMYFYGNPDFFEHSLEPYKDVVRLSPTPDVFIVNQHILAASLIARQFALARDPTITRVILITQNNWNVGNDAVITSRKGWETPLGNIEADTALVDQLVTMGQASINENLFIHEHGITGIVPYVAYAFPNARIVPLVVRDQTDSRVLDALATQLQLMHLTHTVVIGSIDMSHYLPAYLADAHDRKTLQAIEHFDYDALPRLDIDTAPTLRIVMKTAEQRGEQRFIETGHANSADIIDEPDLLSTTSYITGYFALGGPLSQESEPVHLLFTGDVMLDRAVAQRMQEQGAQTVLRSVERLFLGVDAVIINLEGTITSQASVSIPDHSRLEFTFDPSMATFLAENGVTAVSLSNNHTDDFGAGGYAQTKSFLSQAGIASFGSPDNHGELSTSLVIHGKHICLVGYEGFIHASTTLVAAEIQRIRPECDLLVATMHAGTEYLSGHTWQQEQAAHAFIDAGADLVIGTHPHVVEPLEIYKGKAIFYSLGNFIFDQDFSFETTHGLVVDLEWDGSQFRYVFVPISIQREKVSFPDPIARLQTLQALVDSHMTSDVQSAILQSYTLILH